MQKPVFRLILAAMLSSCAMPQAVADAPRPATVAATTEDERLMALFAADQNREQALDPLGTLFRTGRSDPALLRQLFTDNPVRALRASVAQSLAELKRIDRARLSPERQISYDVFAYSKQDEAHWLRPEMVALTAVLPLEHFGGLHVQFPSMMAKGGVTSFDSVDDYDAALALDRAYPQILDNAVVRFRDGLGSGVVASRMTVSNMIAQLDAQLALPAEQSPFFTPVLDFPASVPEADRQRLRTAYRAAIADEIYPAYRRLRTFLADEYLPAAREQVCLCAMKGGAGLYRDLIEQQTTLRLDPEQVHQLGLGEVARIQREMDQVRGQLGFPNGTLREFFDTLRTDPRFHPKTKEQLAEGFAAAGRAVDAQVPRFFNHVPKTKLVIEPYPAYREKYEAGGSYNQGSADGTRPGTFYFNTYDLPSRFLTGIATLYLHEGAPGHHFQISLAQENETLPDFQRFGGNTAYVEGWALYAETLGYPMGLFDDPMQHWGTLDDEMLRAMRLVVDTGLHYKGWSREQAIDYMLANSGMGRSDATAEVERYVVWPGQALGYKIGALTIQRLRKKAEAALGERFDIRAFHDQILMSGALPLPILEAKIDRWIAASKG
ncbi:MAG: DUF885 domain-containing protein [Novosphingobium sp.]|uniref:DUF885 domain-containing protein n=1 Tax=Novosphingobium sp. TaxID=1874826 RepID=UPI001DA55D22|nr:DUF885 domain-containing protein [Novosphingobium sp.]MCB2057835.1 DUF885 domain-containing protein [Novosphingobium sp.]MCP5385216.1 DUF885 domain-containing protein [Novosphingobium sp.]